MKRYAAGGWGLALAVFALTVLASMGFAARVSAQSAGASPPGAAPLSAPSPGAAPLSAPSPGAAAANAPQASPPGAPALPASAADLLKQTMSRYQAMKSFQASCQWVESFAAPAGPKSEPDDRVSRMIWYERPNRFKVVAANSNGFVLTTVCDGNKLVDYSNSASLGAQSYPAPSSFDEATSMQLQMPMFTGSLLYLFFGGPDYIERLANTGKGPIGFGPDQTIGGVACRTVDFVAAGTYGNAQIAIGEQDGLVHAIRYDSAPLIAMMKQRFKGKPAGQVSSLETTETYTNIKIDQPIAESVFTAQPPKGAAVAAMPAPPSEKPPVPIGSDAPAFTLKAAANGRPLTLASLKGKVVLIDFWATWCPPCRKGLPETNRLSEDYEGKGLVVLAVSDESASTIMKFIDQNHYRFTPYRDAGDAAEKAYDIQAIPTDVVIDPQGRLVAYMVGLQDPADILAALKKAGFSPAS